MKIAIIGATGKAGNKILQEVKARGHEITAIVRNKAKLTTTDVAVIEKDLFDLTTADLKEQDVVVDAFNAPSGEEEKHQSSLEHLTNILEDQPAIRLIVVGGAGSLYVDQAKTTRLMDTEDFPKEFLPTASNMGKAFEKLQSNQKLNWTYLSPQAFFNFDGERTGDYQVGTDFVLTDQDGNSEISYADFAVALVDEAEQGNHIKKRFTVGKR